MEGVWLQVNCKLIPYDEMKIQDAEALIQKMDFSQYDKSIRKLMEIKEKYYTPSIEEFYVGFEYEENVYNKVSETSANNSWVKKIFSQETYIHIEDDFNYRVKYLDQEDIESLGFKATSPRYFIIAAPGSLGYFTEVVLDYRWFTSKDCKIYIRGKRGDEHENIFVGQIKNKSELKRLLKQLGIC